MGFVKKKFQSPLPREQTVLSKPKRSGRTNFESINANGSVEKNNKRGDKKIMAAA